MILLCKANNIAFSTKEMEFENIEQVKEWMINNQFSRRNLPLLTESILKEGCRDSLITWNNTIIDGHNRYQK